jgi:hypothetical protein
MVNGRERRERPFRFLYEKEENSEVSCPRTFSRKFLMVPPYPACVAKNPSFRSLPFVRGGEVGQSLRSPCSSESHYYATKTLPPLTPPYKGGGF